MHRRAFLAAVAAIPFLPRDAFAATGFVDYTDGLIVSALAEGKTVFVDYAAKWCSTCARQERVIQALLDENPAYAQNVMFVKVDWDAFRRAPVTTSRNIPRRSTLLVLKGDQELARLVAGTSTDDIRALLDTALAAATNA